MKTNDFLNARYFCWPTSLRHKIWKTLAIWLMSEDLNLVYSVGLFCDLSIGIQNLFSQASLVQVFKLYRFL